MAAKTIIAWSCIPGHPGYRISRNGKIESCWHRKGLGRGRGSTIVLGNEWRRLSTPSDRCGRPRVNLGRGKTYFLARLVLETFIGLCPTGYECCHFPDRNPLNCALSNLRWGTSAENTDDQRKHGTLIGGERHGMAKLTNADVLIIRACIDTQAIIAARFGVSQGHISEILSEKARTPSSHAGRGL